MSYQFDLAKKYGMTDEQIEAYLKTSGSTKAAPQKKPKQTRTAIEKVGGFLGVEQLGRGLGLSAFKYLTKEGRELEKKVRERTASGAEYKAYSEIFGVAPTPAQVVGSAVRTGLTIGTAGLATPAKALARIPLEAGLGAAEAAAGAAEREEAITPELLVTGAAIGVAIPEAFRGIGKLLGAITKKLPARLMNSAIKPTNPKLGQELVDRGFIGNEDTLLKEALDRLSTNEAKLDEFLPTVKGNVKSTTVLSRLNPLRKKYKNSPKLLKILKQEADDWVIKKSYTPVEANVQKRVLYELISDRGYSAGKHPTSVNVMKQIARGFKEGIEEIAPEVKPINADLGIYSQARKALLARTRNLQRQQLGVWGDIILASGGGMFAGIPGGLGAVALKRTAESATGKTLLANVLTKIGTGIEKLPTDEAGRISRTALLNLIAQMKED